MLGVRYATKPYPCPLRDKDPKAIPVLIELLKDPRAKIRWYAADTLAPFGPEAISAVGPLQQLLDDHETGMYEITVAESAARALRKIAPDQSTDRNIEQFSR